MKKIGFKYEKAEKYVFEIHLLNDNVYKCIESMTKFIGKKKDIFEDGITEPKSEDDYVSLAYDTAKSNRTEFKNNIRELEKSRDEYIRKSEIPIERLRDGIQELDGKIDH